MKHSGPEARSFTRSCVRCSILLLHSALVAVAAPPESPAETESSESAASGERAPPPRAQAVRVADRPVLDGRLDDAVWALASPAGPFLQVEPVAGGGPSERTEFRVIYDDVALYIGVWCHDSEPDKIIALEMALVARSGAAARSSAGCRPRLL